MAKKKVTTQSTALQPTSYMEINRVHQSTLSNLKGSLVITAASSGNGTSLLCHILALRSAENGQKTLLIDLNLKNAGLSIELDAERKEWDLPNREPSDLMNDLFEPIKQVDNLHFMAAPRDDESIHFLKDVNRAKAFLTSLERQFDHIIIDTTPVGQINRYNIDPVVLASAASRSVISILSGVTKAQRANRALELLAEGGAEVMGAVMNDRDNPGLRDELLQFISGMQKVSPGFHSWLKYKILNADLPL